MVGGGGVKSVGLPVGSGRGRRSRIGASEPGGSRFRHPWRRGRRSEGHVHRPGGADGDRDVAGRRGLV